jgi:hypothetical protein
MKMFSHLAVIFLHTVTDSQLVSFSICCDSAIGVTAHGYLVRMYQTHLPILVQDTERVSLRFEDNTDSLVTRDE